MYGLYVPSVKLNVTSRKLTIFLLASIVIFKSLSLKIFVTNIYIYIISIN